MLESEKEHWSRRHRGIGEMVEHSNIRVGEIVEHSNVGVGEGTLESEKWWNIATLESEKEHWSRRNGGT